jgi:PBP1b-binding outer membrane lipoprotein LpoB
MGGRVGCAVVLSALALAGCSGGGYGKTTSTQAEPTTTVKIVSALPLQGLAREQAESMVHAIERYLDQIDYRVGDIAINYPVGRHGLLRQERALAVLRMQPGRE